jgi:lysophospholipase L1-like esterase
MRALVPLALLCALTLGCGSGDGDGAAPTPALPEGRGGLYLALGDGIASGAGASEPETAGFVALVAQTLRARYGDDLRVESLAEAGATSQYVIDGQLGRALQLLAAGDARVITITAGGLDLEQYTTDPACLRDPSRPQCPLEEGLLFVEQRLVLILGDLRAAAPDAAIAVLAYPNFFSGTGHQFDTPAEIALDLLDGTIASVAARYDVLVADPRAAFVGKGGELTHLLDPTPDPHPNDAGHRAIADAFLEVLGLGR